MKGGYLNMGNVKIDKSTQVFLVIGMILMLVFGAFAAFKPVEVSIEPVDSDAIAQAVIGAIVLPTANASLTSDKLDAIYDEMFKDDLFEVGAEALAMEELERKDYRELGEFLSDLSFDKDKLEDEDDIADVIVKEVDFKDVDVDEEYATVILELKVYYENLNGKDVKNYVTATVSIVDGEVDKIVFSETD
jgi:hypothetical protein